MMVDSESPAGRSWPHRLRGRRTDRALLSGRRTALRPGSTTTFQAEVELGAPPEDVFDFCLRSENFSGIMPDRITFLAEDTAAGGKGNIYMFRWWLMNAIPVIWVAYVDHYEVGREFADLQLRGVFRYFRHTHTCTPSDTGTRYRDSIEFATVLRCTNGPCRGSADVAAHLPPPPPADGPPAPGGAVTLSVRDMVLLVVGLSSTDPCR